MYDLLFESASTTLLEFGENPKRLGPVFKKTYLDWLGASHNNNNNNQKRETKWTQSVAVGSYDFIKTVKDRLGARAVGRKIENDTDTYELRETLEPYGDFKTKNDEIEMKNLHLWDSETE